MKNKSYKFYSKLITSAFIASSLVIPTNGLNAQAATPSNIIVNNNSGIADTVTFKRAKLKDVVKVYNAAGDTLLGSATAKKAGDVTVSLKEQLTEATVQITLTNYNKNESGQVTVDVPPEAITEAPDASKIVVNNNVSIADSVTVKGLKAKDVVKVYDGDTLLGTATAKKDGSLIVALKAPFTQEQVKVSLTNYSKKESDKTPIAVPDEVKTTKPDSSKFVANHNVSMADTVIVKSVKAKDVVNVYDGDTLLGTATAKKDGPLTLVLKTPLTQEQVQVTLTTYNRLESDKADVPVTAGAKTTAPSEARIKVNNNVGIADTVVVKNVKPKDIVKVYDGDTMLGTATAKKDGDLTVALKAPFTTQTVQVSLTNVNKNESERTPVNVPGEATTNAPSKIVVNNNVSIADSVLVKGLKAKDVVKVYDGDTVLGTATAKKDGDLTVNLKAPLTQADVQVSLTNYNKNESEKVTAAVPAEAETTAPAASKIVANHNVSMADTVVVKGVKAKDVVKVYDGDTVLGTATAKTDGILTVVLKAPLTQTEVQVSLTNYNRRESDKTTVTVTEGPKTIAPDASKIAVYNNVGIADTVVVKGIKAKDVVKVYEGDTLIGTATAKTDGSLTVSLKPQITQDKVQVTLTKLNKNESPKTDVNVPEEAVTTALNGSKIVVKNNVGIADTVVVKGLKAKDVVKVYDGDALIGTATAKKDGSLTVALKAQISQATIQVTLTKYNRRESEKTDATVPEEETTQFPL